MAPPPPGSQVAPLPINLPFRVVSKTIGQGAYASIRKAVPRNASSPIIAVKFINKDHAFNHGRVTPKQLKMEITLHQYLAKHPNIIQCLGAGEDTLWTWIAMELADGGDLFDKIEADEGVGEDIAHLYFTQLLSAVEYMHSKGIAHRDLKPENVLLSEDGNLKLADFGLAALFKKDGQVRLCNTICGSPPYIAPEVVSGRRSRRTDLLDQGYEANICDIWSCGVVLFVLLVGNTPWDEPTMNSDEYREYVETGQNPTDPLWDPLSPPIMSLLRGMLKVDPKERVTLEDMRNHTWVRRKNPYLSSDGTNANPVGLATQMLSQLRIDFSRGPTPSQQTYSQDSEAMDVDSIPHRSRAYPSNISLVSSTQPETPTAESHFDWERPPRLGTHDGIPASQPTQMGKQQPFSPSQPPTSTPYLSQLPSSTQDMLSQDPSLTQFSATPAVPLTLTQAARNFKDVLPSYSLARFLSTMPISSLLPLLADALHQLGIPSLPPTDKQLTEWEHSGEATLRVKMADGRRQGLNGHIVVERVEIDSNMMCDVRFVKASGDPLEWRRFFKNVVLILADVVLRPA
ncbi:serine/threonine-protein kinase-like protein chk1 [Dendryphion nanum]|uniref:non-specific serine/threonine protein kinase n=1 Tax=Dendryphion nanum TaxID=256645 RepID=A0A9P9ILY4_9PLEO|nr:serine/threonine-protein kinase-like protein chk1 [Dendryphion nanum]